MMWSKIDKTSTIIRYLSLARILLLDFYMANKFYKDLNLSRIDFILFFSHKLL